MVHVLTCFLRHRGEVLFVRRDGGQWDGLSVSLEGPPADPAAAAGRAVGDLVDADATLVRTGAPFTAGVGDAERTVHPALFDVAERPTLDEFGAVEWLSPPVVCERDAVPGLWTAYERVAPSATTVRADDEHGSAWISVRALEVLRNCAAVADEWEAVAATARALRTARPSMAAVANRVNRVMAEADRTPSAVCARAEAAIAAAVEADDAAARAAATLLEGRVATLSRSGTALSALREARPAVVVGESRPDREGVGVAETLAGDGLSVTLATDAALPGLVGGTVPDAPAVDSVLVGADAVLPDGSVVNKVGTYPLALAAAEAGLPVRAVAARDKVRPDAEVHGETGDPGALYDGAAGVTVASPLFERTPADLLAGVVTEDGTLTPSEVATVAADHRAAAGWDAPET